MEKKGNFWRFSIKDNGIGISEKYLTKIIDLFQQLHPRDKYEGNGIGLSFCKKIVHLHDGTIWMESELNHGSTIYFTIKEKGINA